MAYPLPAVPPMAAPETAVRTRLQALLEENAAAMRDVRTSTVCAASTIDPLLPASSPAAEPERAGGEAARAELARLRAELAEANERAATIVECERKRVEIRTTLLAAGHDEALAARDEARAEAAALRAKLEAATSELATCRRQLSVVTRTAEAELGILAAQADAERHELAGRREGATSVAGVHLHLLHMELRMTEHTMGERQMAAAAAALPPGRATGGASAGHTAESLAALRELQQWSAPPAGEADKARAHMLQRLERLEATAEAAGERFDALQREHDALRRKYARLKQRARGGAARPSSPQEAS